MRRWGRGPRQPAWGVSATEDGVRFRDRAAAGRILARRLAVDDLATSDVGGPLGGDPTRVVVLGIPRGGVPVAAAIAGALGVRLDVLVAHKVGAPGEPELAVGAVAADGSIRREAWAGAYLSTDAFDLAAAAEISRARARAADLRAGRDAVPLDGATAVLVDDGIATGSTMLVAIEAARRAGAARVVVAVPVAAEAAMMALASAADAVVVVAVPRHFQAVGEWYERFDQVGDGEVRALLAAGAG